MEIVKWAEQVQDRSKWKDIVEMAKTVSELSRHRRKRRRGRRGGGGGGTGLNTFNIIVFRRQQWLRERVSLFFIRTHFAGLVFRLPSSVCFDEGSVCTFDGCTQCDVKLVLRLRSVKYAYS